MKFIIEVEMELPCDDEGLTSQGWTIYSQFVDAMNKLYDDYGWKEIQHIGNPKRKAH